MNWRGTATQRTVHDGLGRAVIQVGQVQTEEGPRWFVTALPSRGVLGGPFETFKEAAVRAQEAFDKGEAR